MSATVIPDACRCAIYQGRNAGRIRYTGQIALPELAPYGGPSQPLYSFKARIYAPKLGRFLQTDPIGAQDDRNLYAYVGNDPLNKTDTTGLFADRAAQGVSSAASAIGNFLSRPVPGVYTRTDSVFNLTGTLSFRPTTVGELGLDLLSAIGVVRPIAGLGLAAEEGETIVIGEGMADRVIPTAEANGASYYNPPKAPPEQWMQNNQNWINQKMDQGCTILDCGAAPGRANYPNPTSPYYQMELDQIMGRGYQNYSKIPAVGE